MIGKDQCMVLPAAIASTLSNICLLPPGDIPQQDHWPQWIGDFSWSGVNADILPLAPIEVMQFGHARQCLL